MTKLPPRFRSGLRASATLAALCGALLATSVRADEPDRFLGLLKPVVATKPLTFGVTVVHLQDDYWKGMVYGIADEARRTGTKVVQVGVAGAYGNVAQQFSQIQTMESKGADVIVVGPAAYDGYDPILQAAKKQGKMVVAAGIPLNSSAIDFGVVQDDTSIGRGLGEFICKDKGDAPATVLSIPGPAGAEWAHLRAAGLKEAAAKCKGLTVIEGPVGGAISISYGLSQASDMLQRNPEAKYFFTPQISLGMGAAQAVKQKHLPTKVVSSTVVKEIFPMLQDGSLSGVSTEPSILLGRLVVQYAIRKNEGMPLPNLKTGIKGMPYPALVVPQQVLTKATAPSYPYQLTDIPPADWTIDQAAR